VTVGIGDLERSGVEVAVAYVAAVLDEGRDLDADDAQSLLMLQDDPEDLLAALRDLYAKRQARGLAAPARVVDLGRVRAALARLDRAVEQHPQLTTARARERLAAWLEEPPTPPSGPAGDREGPRRASGVRRERASDPGALLERRGRGAARRRARRCAAQRRGATPPSSAGRSA